MLCVSSLSIVQRHCPLPYLSSLIPPLSTSLLSFPILPIPLPQLALSLRDIGLDGISQACEALPRSLALAILSCFDAFKQRLDGCMVEESAAKGGTAVGWAERDSTPRASGMLR